MKEILGTILDPSSRTEDFAAPLPEAYRAVTLLLPPVLFRAGIGMTPQLQPEITPWDEVAARVPGDSRQRTKDEQF
jgi:hypothetical protein